VGRLLIAIQPISFFCTRNNKIYVKLTSIIERSQFRGLLYIFLHTKGNHSFPFRNLLHRFAEAYFVTFLHRLHADSEPIPYSHQCNIDSFPSLRHSKPSTFITSKVQMQRFYKWRNFTNNIYIFFFKFQMIQIFKDLEHFSLEDLNL
jgi:hypothetical protein